MFANGTYLRLVRGDNVGISKSNGNSVMRWAFEIARVAIWIAIILATFLTLVILSGF